MIWGSNTGLLPGSICYIVFLPMQRSCFDAQSLFAKGNVIFFVISHFMASKIKDKVLFNALTPLSKAPSTLKVICSGMATRDRKDWETGNMGPGL